MTRIFTGILMIISYWAAAQQTLTDSFGSVTAITGIAAHETANKFDLDALTYSGTADLRNTNVSSGYTGASGGANVYFTSNTNANFIIRGLTPNASCAGANSTTVTVGLRKENIGENGNNFIFEYSTNGGSSWSTSASVSPSLPTGTGTTGWYVRSWSAPGNANAFRFQNTSNSNTFRIDDLIITNSNSGCSLPVHLISFKSEAQVAAVELSWQTSEEVNNSHFEVEKSSDAKTFEVIGQVTGKETGNIRQVYSYTDIFPRPGLNYYRLKQIDFDGKFEYSRIIAAKFTGMGVVKAYPNPVTSTLTIELPLNTELELASLLDLAGHKVRAFSSKNLTLEGIENGIYMLHVKTKDGATFQQRILKMN